MNSLFFEDLGSRRVVADFSDGHISSDGGELLLRQLDRSLGLTSKLASCFSDHRTALHSVSAAYPFFSSRS